MGEVSSGFIAFKELERSRFARDKVMSSDLFDLESDLLGRYQSSISGWWGISFIYILWVTYLLSISFPHKAINIHPPSQEVQGGVTSQSKIYTTTTH